MKIKKGDQVEIISGKDRGKRGKVLRALPEIMKITVEKINIAKKHVRPKKESEKGQRIEIPVPVDVSNAMLICPKCGKLTRVGHKIEKKNKFRICKKCGSEL